MFQIRKPQTALTYLATQFNLQYVKNLNEINPKKKKKVYYE